MDTTKVKEIIQLYFDGSYEGNAEKMDKVFHQAAHIYGLDKDGNLSDRPRDEFVARVGSRPADAPSYARYDEILSIEFTGENTAVAIVKLRVQNTLYTDVLSLMCINGNWGVIAKMLAGVPVA